MVNPYLPTDSHQTPVLRRWRLSYVTGYLTMHCIIAMMPWLDNFFEFASVTRVAETSGVLFGPTLVIWVGIVAGAVVKKSWSLSKLALIDSVILFAQLCGVIPYVQ